MSVTRCHLCTSNPRERKLYGRQGLPDGEDCPVCYQPTCRYHLTTVRWRWVETREADEALVCKDCKNSYAHRKWEAHRREWIT